MYLLLILFFSSFIGIVIMIGRKVYLLQNGQSTNVENISFEIPYVKEIKRITTQGIRKYIHAGLVIIIRLYVQFSNFTKNKHEEIKTKIRDIHYRKSLEGNSSEKTGVSGFLKIVSEYKHKIRDIKQKIHEEEKNS